MSSATLGVDGVGEIADQDYGLREFILADPDGNQVRIGSPAPTEADRPPPSEPLPELHLR